MVSEATDPPAVYVARSPADVLRLVVALACLVALLLLEWLFGDTLVGFASDLLRGLEAMPDWIVDVLSVSVRVLAALVLIAGLLYTVVRSGWRMLLTVAVAVAIACALVAVFANLTESSQGSTVVDVAKGLGPLTEAGFPTTFGIAAFAAALTAGAPWLARRWRRWGWVALIGMVFTRFFSSAISFDSFRAAFIGWVAGAGTLVLLGAPSRRPTADAVRRALAGVGLVLTELEAASVDARGSTPYFGAGPDGSRYFVKVLGEDQRSADLLFRLYRSIQRRDLGDERPFSSLRRAVEHEAFVALAARDLGVRTPRVRAVASVEPNGFVLAYDAVEGRSLDRLEPAQITDDVLEAIWGQVGKLRSHRIAHRDLRLANVFLGADGEAWMIDFGFSELAASDLLLANDVMELVASSSVVVGPERATAHAKATVDPTTLAEARDRLHPWAMSGATRSAIKSDPELLDDLRQRLDAT